MNERHNVCSSTYSLKRCNYIRLLPNEGCKQLPLYQVKLALDLTGHIKSVWNDSHLICYWQPTFFSWLFKQQCSLRLWFFLPTSATNLFAKRGKELLKEGHGVPMKLPLVNRYLVSFLSVGKQGVFDEVTMVLLWRAIRDEMRPLSHHLSDYFCSFLIRILLGGRRMLSFVINRFTQFIVNGTRTTEGKTVVLIKLYLRHILCAGIYIPVTEYYSCCFDFYS